MKIITVLSALAVFQISAQSFIKFGEVKRLSEVVNTSSEEIMPLVSNDGSKFYFVRVRHEENEGGADAGHDMWSADFIDNELKNSHNDFGKLNNEGNNAIVGITSDNSKLYLLNAYKTESKLEKGVALSNKDFSKPTFVQIKNMDYSSQFYGFYVNPEETAMFISMEGPNTMGKEDLYVSIGKEGVWGEPIHLGANINSAGYEMSPFLSRDGKRLYFSSNGHGGQGDADIFYVERTGSGWMSWSDPINIGSNINSPGFDAYFTEGPDSVAYFASTRESKNSDIYSLKISWEEEVVAEIVELVEEPKEIEPSENPPLPDPNVGNIYFDNNRYYIREDAEKNLDYLVEVMKEMPNLLVTLEGHADNTHHAKSNQTLSENRSKEAKKYLVKKGIDNTRISLIGYGETKPDVPCDDCSEEQLQKNRRVEFVLSWKK